MSKMQLNIKTMLLHLTIAMWTLAVPAISGHNVDVRTYHFCENTDTKGPCTAVKLYNDVCRGEGVASFKDGKSFKNAGGTCLLCKGTNCNGFCLYSYGDVADLNTFSDNVESVKCSW